MIKFSLYQAIASSLVADSSSLATDSSSLVADSSSLAIDSSSLAADSSSAADKLPVRLQLQLHKIVGARGTWKINLKAGEICAVDWEFTGLYADNAADIGMAEVIGTRQSVFAVAESGTNLAGAAQAGIS